MSDSVETLMQENPENPPSSGPSDAGHKKALRRKTIKFVSVFVVSVFVLLFGYELARWTKFNDWYLLQVARSTAVLLKPVGYSCELGNAERYRGREVSVRAALEALRHGEEAPKLPPTNASKADSSTEPPLTAWEAWEYQAATYRQSMTEAKQELARLKSDATLAEPERSQQIQAEEMKLAQMKQRDTGPLVSFVLKPGLGRRLTDTKLQLAELEKDSSLPEDVRAKQIEQKRAEAAQLEEQAKQEDVSAQGNPKARRDVGFNFIVVPDCGAVQAMAIFLAAILAFPARWWKRFVGILIGLPILYWVNALRLACLAVVGAIDNGGKWFRFSHEYVWQGIYIVFVVALWMGWVEFLVRRRSS